jgi:hypothetical protein
MKDELFKELEKSIKDGAKILKGKQKPFREFSFENPDPKINREQLVLSQLGKRFCNR